MVHTAVPYVGAATSNSTVSPKQYADSQYAQQAVTLSYINAQVAIKITAATLVTQAYFDTQKALLANKTDVDTADNAYVPVAKLGAANGVAQLDGNSKLPSAQFPLTGVPVDRTMQSYSASGANLILPSNSSATVTDSFSAAGGSALRNRLLAKVVVPDPGYPWIPLPFAWVQGNSSAGNVPGDRFTGNSSYGLLSVIPPLGVSNTVYGTGVCTASPYTNTYSVVPYAGAGQTPITIPPVTGGLELHLYGCCWSGGTYTFYGANMSFVVFVVPSM